MVALAVSHRAYKRFAVSLLGLCLSIAPQASVAHCLVGGRLFPATVAIDDPCVNDEAALPQLSSSGIADLPGHRNFQLSAEYAKRITDEFGFTVAQGWIRRTSPEGLLRGLSQLSTGLKYQFLTLPEQEIVLSAGLDVAWGGTGRAKLDATPYNIYTPMFFFGKGLGDLPFSLNYLRPLAITGQLGYAVPGWSQTRKTVTDGERIAIAIERNPDMFLWGFTVQYSIPYFLQNVKDFDLPYFFRQTIPLVEFAFQRPVANTATSGTRTSGAISPGFVFTQKAWQFAVEADIPINESHHRAVGFRGQLHFILDEILPETFTKPLAEHFR